MSIYNPLREGFRELNRMMVDRQVFDAQNKAREAEDIRQESVLASKLEQREFENRMAEKAEAFKIAQFEQTADQNRIKNKLAEDQLQVDKDYKEKSNAIGYLKAKTAQEKAAKDNALTEVKIEHEEQKRQLLEHELQRKNSALEMKPVEDVFTNLGWDYSSLKDNPEVMGNLAERIGADRWSVENQRFETGGGEPFNMSLKQAMTRHGLVQEVIDDSLARIPEQQAELRSSQVQHNSIAAQMKALSANKSSNPANLSKIEELAQQKSELNRRIVDLKEKVSDPGRLNALEEQIERAERAMLTLSVHGMDEAAATKYDQIESMRDRAKTLREDLEGKDINTIQKLAIEYDDKGRPIGSRLFNINKRDHLTGVEPHELDENLKGGRWKWQGTFGKDGVYGDTSGIKSADRSWLTRTINQEFGSAGIDGFKFHTGLQQLAAGTTSIAMKLALEEDYAGNRIGLVPEAAKLEMNKIVREWAQTKQEIIEDLTEYKTNMWGEEVVSKEPTEEEIDEELKKYTDRFQKRTGIVPNDEMVGVYNKWYKGKLTE